MTCSFDGTPVTPLGEALRAYFDPTTKGYRQADNFMPWAPGTAAAYNNVGYALLGYLVERIAGQSLDDYCQAHLFRPLDLRASFLQRGLDERGILSAMPYDRPGKNPRFLPYGRYDCWMYPAATLRTDVLSYARFLLLHMNEGKLNGSPRILDSTTTTMMHTSAYLDVPGFWGTRQPWYGIGFMTGAEWGADMVGHEGGYVGVYTYAFFHKPTNVGVVILINGETMDLKEFWLLTDAMVGRLMEVASATSQ